MSLGNCLFAIDIIDVLKAAKRPTVGNYVALMAAKRPTDKANR